MRLEASGSLKRRKRRMEKFCPLRRWKSNKIMRSERGYSGHEDEGTITDRITQDGME
jgi:hypothetical protein